MLYSQFWYQAMPQLTNTRELWLWYLISNFQELNISCEIAFSWMSKDLTDVLVNIGSGNG